MHYKIAADIIIKSENAAKPKSQVSSHLRSLLEHLPPVSASLDYGCGKLRYCNAILDKTDTLAIVDSEIQLSRVQKLDGVTTTIRDALRRSNRISVFNDVEFTGSSLRFDRAFCINVLSVIPFFAKRMQVLDVIRAHLRRHATCLFVVQYRNSDFTRMRAMPNARPWRDGFLIDSLRGFSFYGLISPERLVSMVKCAGFEIRDVHLFDGSAYVWATRG